GAPGRGGPSAGEGVSAGGGGGPAPPLGSPAVVVESHSLGGVPPSPRVAPRPGAGGREARPYSYRGTVGEIRDSSHSEAVSTASRNDQRRATTRSGRCRGSRPSAAVSASSRSGRSAVEGYFFFAISGETRVFSRGRRMFRMPALLRRVLR